MARKAGRKSRSEIDMEAEGLTGKEIVPSHRLQPPLAFSGLAEEMWLAIVQAMPPDWIDETSAPMLEAYITHVMRARRIQAELELFEAARDAELDAAARGEGGYVPLEVAVYNQLTIMYRRETNALSNIAGKMRISPSSRYSADWRPGKGGKGTRKRPWEFDG